MNSLRDTCELTNGRANCESLQKREEILTLKIEGTSISSNNEVENKQNKFTKVHRNLVKIFLKTRKEKPSKDEIKAEECTLSRSNKVCFSSCMCGTLSASNSPVESEETKKCPVFTCFNKTDNENISEVKHIETLLKNSRSSSEPYNGTEKSSRASIPLKQEFKTCIPKSVPSSLVNRSAEPNLCTHSKFASKTASNIKDSADSCTTRINQRNGNENRVNNQQLYSTKENIIGHRSISNDVNLCNGNVDASSISNKKNEKNHPCVSLLSSDGSLRRYTTNTLTLIEDTPILDDDIIYSYLNEYKSSPEKIQGFVSLPSKTTSICSDDVFYNNDSFDSAKYQRDVKGFELKFQTEKRPERDSGYDPQYDILNIMSESFVVAPPPSLGSKHCPANVTEVCSSAINASLSENSNQISSKYTRETPLDSTNGFYQTGRLKSENSFADTVTNYKFGNSFKSTSLPRNIKKLAAVSVFTNKVNPNYNSIVNKYKLTTLDYKNLRYEHPSQTFSRPCQSSNNNTEAPYDNQMYFHKTKKATRPFYGNENCGKKFENPSNETVYTCYGYV